MNIGRWVAAAMLAAGSAHAGDLFDGLSPEMLGEDLTTVLEGAELACKQDSGDASVRRCQPLPGALDTVGGAKVMSIEALFIDDELARIAVYFSNRDFSKVTQYVTQRLGSGQDWTVTLRGGMNMGFKDEIFIWDKPELQAVLQQYDRRIDRASLIYGSPRAMSEVLREIKATPAGGVRDL